MEIRTVLLITLAALAAIAIVFYQYYYKSPRKGTLKLILAALRFVALFCALLLLVNPKFVKKDYFLEKSNLILLVDNSSSMLEAAAATTIAEKIKSIKANSDVNNRFSVQQYAFGTKLEPKDSFLYDEKNTDISTALSTVDELFVNSSNAIVLVTDGNQTLGKDYSYLNLSENISVNSIVVGDTTKFDDIAIGQVNSNTYAFLKNKFPVEVSILYTGTGPVSKTVSISMDGKTVYRQTVNLDSKKNSYTLNTLLEAESVGVKSLTISVETLSNERNTFNNNKETAIEVIDEKTNITLVTDILHPDLGAIKKAIEANEQRSVSIVKPSVGTNLLEETDLYILYQPNRKFKPIYDHISKTKSNVFTITGTQTDWGFLNQVQNGFFKERLNQSEEIIPVLNRTFGVFGLGDFNVDDFPPLQSKLGDIEFKKQAETILLQRIRGIDLDKPLFSVLTDDGQKEAVLFGENIWRWRAQTYRNSQDFADFDDFIGRLMVYLASNNQRSRLELDHNLVFDHARLAKIRVSYFDESYVFDANADIIIKVTTTTNGFSRESPMLLKGSYYETDLSDLKAGSYNYTVTVDGENLKRSGAFKIVDFNPEKQRLSSNHTKLKQLADDTGGQLYFPNDVDSLISDLNTSERYIPVQKSTQNVVSLIDFRFLLGVMALALALEWFIRKYNGLI